MDLISSASRRRFVASGCGLVPMLLVGGPSAVWAQASTELPRPNPAMLQSGDFVWPKKPGAYVPYNAGSRNTAIDDREQWTAERDAYLRRYSTVIVSDPVLQKRLELLQSLEFREFLSVYAGGQLPGPTGGLFWEVLFT